MQLIGYQFSVYTWIARLVLRVVEQSYDYVEVNPFEPEGAAGLPFGRVPVLRHEFAEICETGAITRYLARRFERLDLLGATPLEMAQVDQVIGIVDAYGYQPMVRKAFAHAVFRPRVGEVADRSVVSEGIAEAQRVLRRLESIYAKSGVLSGASLTLADLHLAPMMDYFLRVPEAADCLAPYPALGAWWDMMQVSSALRETAPDLSVLQDT